MSDCAQLNLPNEQLIIPFTPTKLVVFTTIRKVLTIGKNDEVSQVIKE